MHLLTSAHPHPRGVVGESCALEPVESLGRPRHHRRGVRRRRHQHDRGLGLADHLSDPARSRLRADRRQRPADTAD